MGKYTQDSKDLLNYLGGKDNIAAVTHCVTRMRFVLRDAKNTDVEKIEALSSVKGTFTQAGQFQVIIGNDVDVFYNDFIDVSGIEGTTKDSVKEMAKTNQNKLQQLASNLAEIFAPIIPAIIVGGYSLDLEILLVMRSLVIMEPLHLTPSFGLEYTHSYG
ncbi:PTS transporter subunit EIIB [Erysipelothrix inopinata]|uniref:PTS transporter subunit EIIB n=1 Tax=Erysipelothrix inopinata TaxID=225084 RepID=UPI001FE5988C|nr:PTS transporter subunit EIIB [Erysipelothrix inopinata]